MKNIRRFSLIIAIIVAFSSILCVGVSAHENNEESIYPEATEYSTTIETQEIIVVVPEMYQYYAFSEEDKYYTFLHGETDDSVFVDVQANDCVPNGISALTEDEVKRIFTVNFLSEGDESGVDLYDITYDAFEIVTINGVKMYKLQGAYLFDDGSLPDDELYGHGFCCYMTATKENLYFVSIISTAEEFTQQADMDKIIGSTYVNGTFFAGDKTTSTEDFSSKRPYAEAVAEDAAAFINSYYGDDFYYDDESLSGEDLESYRKIVKIVCIVLMLICAVPTVIVVAIAISLIVKNSKNKKKLDELEKNAFTQPAPNGFQPYAQPIVNTQPVVNEQPVLNGESTDTSDK